MPDKTPDTRVTVRYAQAEYALLKEKAGDRPISTFIRELTLGEAAERRALPSKAPIKDHVALARVLAQLGQNQLVADFKSVSGQVDDGVLIVEEDVAGSFERIETTLSLIHQLLMNALGVAER